MPDPCLTDSIIFGLHAGEQIIFADVARFDKVAVMRTIVRIRSDGTAAFPVTASSNLLR
jgi:hypothetical protein